MRERSVCVREREGVCVREREKECVCVFMITFNALCFQHAPQPPDINLLTDGAMSGKEIIFFFHDQKKV